jgi:cell division protein FtsL
MRTRFQPWKILLLLVVLWVGFNFARNAFDNYQLKQKISALEKQLVVLELRGEELEKEIAEWQSPENIERIAREELGLVKPGEVMYILSEPLTADVERDVKKR